ncbi:MAG: hypothetical protein MUE50_02880, partial [Pirellulaceae bacterium]|nr:hypothetical protein [Pirellulaceae bacterium]
MNVTRRFRPNPSTASGLLLLAACALTAFRSSPAAAADGLVFLGPDNGEYQFDTGILKGVLHRGGRSTGLLPVSDVASGKVLTKSMGWLSPYRTLSTGTQHGYGAWDWASETRLLPDGAVEVRWPANDTYPLNMTAVYRWSAANTADLEMAVTPQKDLPQLEIFVASYFEGFTQAFVYAQDAATGQAKFVPALKEDAVWHVFPRDGEVAKLVGDGRWQHPPAPVTWTVRNPLAAPLAIRRNPELGLTAPPRTARRATARCTWAYWAAMSRPAKPRPAEHVWSSATRSAMNRRSTCFRTTFRPSADVERLCVSDYLSAKQQGLEVFGRLEQFRRLAVQAQVGQMAGHA